MAHGRYDLTEFEWNVIKPLLPNKARGVPSVDDRRVLNGIFYQLRSGSPWQICPRDMGLTRRSTIASTAGGKPVSGTGSWMQSSLPMRPKARSCSFVMLLPPDITSNLGSVEHDRASAIGPTGDTYAVRSGSLLSTPNKFASHTSHERELA